MHYSINGYIKLLLKKKNIKILLGLNVTVFIIIVFFILFYFFI